MQPDARRVLFLQVANPAAYPPTLHAAELMADAGWRVTLLAAPIRGDALSMTGSPHVELKAIAERPSHVIGRGAWLSYVAAAAGLALQRRPHVIYASDPLSAGAALAAAQLSGARLVYHEHDSPAAGASRRWVDALRRHAAARAELVVLPNAERAAVVGAYLGVAEKTVTVWNLPTRRELPRLDAAPRERLELYYHGNISPELLPETVVHAIACLGRPARLRIVGYEAPGARGYIRRLVELGARSPALVEYAGEVSRGDLLSQATSADVGLALMPASGVNFNLRHLVGASNKAFDYMAAGQALLVSDLPEWRQTFEATGYARACDPTDPAALSEALTWFADHPEERRAMGLRGRARIERDWNYDTAFAPILARLSA